MTIRVLYLGMQWDYGFRERGPSYEEMAFHAGLDAHSGVDVIHFDYVDLFNTVGKDEMNRRLVEIGTSGEHDVLFCVMFQDQLDARAVRQVSAAGTTTVAWGCDDHWRFDDFSSVWAPDFDLWVTTARSAVARFASMGYDRVVKSQWAVAPTTFHPVDVERDIDVSFIGLPHGNRRQVIAQLEEAGIDVQVFGRGWDGDESRITHDEMLSVMSRSKMCLNLSNPSTLQEPQIKGRIFEIPACRSLLLTDHADDLESYYTPGEEIALFDSYEELPDRIRYYLEHDEERERIATAGYERTLSEHTWKHRFDDIFAAVGAME